MIFPNPSLDSEVIMTLAYFDVAFGSGYVESSGSSLGVSDVTKYFGIEPLPGVFKHQPLFRVPGGFAVDALPVNLFLEEFLHLVRLGDVNGQFAVVVDSRDTSTVIKKESGEKKQPIFRDQDGCGVSGVLLCNTEETAGGRGVQRRPALVVAPVDVGAPLDQELDHLEVVVDAGLVECGQAVDVGRVDVCAPLDEPVDLVFVGGGTGSQEDAAVGKLYPAGLVFRLRRLARGVALLPPFELLRPLEQGGGGTSF